MANESSTALSTADREILSTRIFNATRELVWKAWTNPDHIAQWWGPIGFTTTTKAFDFKPGGQWLHTMHGPDGTDYRNDITYLSIVEPELIEYDHGPSPVFHVTVTLAKEGDGKTKLSMVALFPTAAERDRTAEKFGAIEGMHQTLGRLEEFLELELTRLPVR